MFYIWLMMLFFIKRYIRYQAQSSMKEDTDIIPCCYLISHLKGRKMKILLNNF